MSSIARAAATLFPDNDMPIRLCYTGNTFVNYPQSYQGRLRENTQMGAELIGVESIEADAEMLALVVDCLTTIGLREFQISVGNVDYFQSLIEDAGLKGVSVGGAQVSTLHSGFVINRGGATATDILQLMALIQNTVYDKFGVKLEPEVRIITG